MNRRTLVFAATALIASARGASAHARLRSASPAAGERLAAAPKEVSIVFSEALEPKFSTIDVHNAAGVRFDTGAARSGVDAKTLVVAVKPLPPGDYTVVWHATSIDTHKTEGSYNFTLLG
ncbi:MAG: copper resistance protein CopC [Alphaproteobacteria bacterium]|nr:copper resistance protein CopC [Alphaproteobacteria bacterium]